MRFLYIFPHPDDESFGPAPGMAAQLRAGHEVHLYTLTQGGATKQRFRLGIWVEEMGRLRVKEMEEVEKTLGLSGMRIDDFPDSGLAEIDPRPLERAITEHIEALQPDILVTYPVHGLSGFHDHLVTHAVVKRVFLELKDTSAQAPKRLALFTLAEDHPGNQSGTSRLIYTKNDLVDCRYAVTADDVAEMGKALDCYVTYQEVIERTGVRDSNNGEVCYELFGEDFSPPLGDLTEKLPG